MRDRPAGADLLAIARETLMREVIPGLPDERKLAAMMAARAIEIVQREAEAGDAPIRAAVQALATLYGEAVPDGNLEPAWRRLAGRLAADLRADALGDAQRLAAWRALLAHADARVGESNPRARDA